MKNLYLILAGLLSIQLTAQNIPFNTVPDWTSNANGNYSTGLGIADINGDGFKDLIVANGNDMARQHLVVYYNLGDGTFHSDPDWQSQDVDYHGHISCGDIDQDGDIDVAVSVYIGPEGFDSPGKLKVYYNTGTELESSPSFVSDSMYTFSCALGDADGDGDLDIAVTAGEPYSGLLDYGRIFINNNGTFQPTPQWQSDTLMGALDVDFGDINRDGFLDLIFVSEGTPNYIYLSDNTGHISTSPAWSSSESVNYINSVDIGYEGGQTIVAMTENSQLGGQGRVRRYDFGNPIPQHSNASWYSYPFGQGSGVLLADVNLDGTLDLIYGGWWLPIKIALGSDGSFEMDPSYTSATGSVVEAIQMADLGREDIIPKSQTIDISLEQAGKNVLILDDQLVENIIAVRRNGTYLPGEEYSFVSNKNWVTFNEPFVEGEEVIIDYDYSPVPDMVISNWDTQVGNYIFYNTNGTNGITENATSKMDVRISGISPNPSNGQVLLKFNLPVSSSPYFILKDMTGREIMRTKECVFPRGDNQYLLDLRGFPSGNYLINITDGKYSATEKLILANH